MAFTFQRLVDTIIGPCKGFAIAYLDVILIYSRSWPQHRQHLARVFQRLGAGLRVNPKKSKLGFKQLDYLGYTIGGGQIRPQIKKIEAIHNQSRPHTKKQLWRFLGMTGYYTRFIPNFTVIACPLTDRLMKGLPEHIQWDSEAKLAMTRLKTTLCTTPVLYSPNV